MKVPVYALYDIAIALYAGVQTVESYLITPLIQNVPYPSHPLCSSRARPPWEDSFGIIGLFLTTPPIVTLMVIAQMLYVHDALGDDIHVMGPDT